MIKRSAFSVICLALVMSVAPLAHAQGKAGQNSGNSAAAQESNGNSHGRDESAGADTSGAQGQDSGPVSPESSSPSDEDDALDAVQAGEAVSLERILPNIRAASSGDVIDARLVRREDVLFYEVKLLEADGRVHMRYYEAHSGRLIGGN